MLEGKKDDIDKGSDKGGIWGMGLLVSMCGWVCVGLSCFRGMCMGYGK